MGKTYEFCCIRCGRVFGIPASFSPTTISKPQPPTFTEMDIHMPTVACSPNPHNNGSQSSGNAKEDLLTLMEEKDIVEAELKALGGVLDSVSSPCQKRYSST